MLVTLMQIEHKRKMLASHGTKHLNVSNIVKYVLYLGIQNNHSFIGSVPIWSRYPQCLIVYEPFGL